MKPTETLGTPVKRRLHPQEKYRQVFDQSKRRIRGLWRRGEAFYAQLTIEDAITGKKVVRRLRLEDGDGVPVETVAQAVAAMAALRVQRNQNEGSLAVDLKRTPTFGEFADNCLAHHDVLKAKRPRTLETERSCISRLKEFMGATRLRAINKALVSGYQAKRSSDSVGPRTINLEMVILRNVLRRAVDDGLVSGLSIEGMKWLKHQAGRRPLLTHEQIKAVCRACIEVSTPGTPKPLFRPG